MTLTTDLIGPALDWAVAKCEDADTSLPQCTANYSTDWAQGGPIIERERISIIKQDPPADNWWAFNEQQRPGDAFGPTPLVAAMRCYVASKLGYEVEVPEELL